MAKKVTKEQAHKAAKVVALYTKQQAEIASEKGKEAAKKYYGKSKELVSSFRKKLKI